MNRFTVIDAHNCYVLYDEITERSVCLGDGVGINFGDDTTDLECGMVGFAKAWEEEANTDFGSYFEIYFPDLYELEIYDNPKFIDCYTVVLEEASPLEKMIEHCGDLHHCLGLSIYPDSPQGFSQHGYASPAAMKDTKRIHFLDLPENVQAHLARRLEDE